MAAVRGWRRAWWRLLGLQAAWDYQRMQGLGMGWAADPVLRALYPADHPRYREAVARASGFFNANPFLAGAALGATLRLEADQAPGPQIERLRTTLGGPLGALGDRLFWAGLVPGLAALAALGVVLGGGLWPILAAVAIHSAIRLWLAGWLLALGWRQGPMVGGALAGSFLPRLSSAAVNAAGALGMALAPLAAVWLLGQAPRAEGLAVGGLMAGLAVLRILLGPRASALRLTLIAAGAVLLWTLVRP